MTSTKSALVSSAGGGVGGVVVLMGVRSAGEVAA